MKVLKESKSKKFHLPYILKTIFFGGGGGFLCGGEGLE